jgi:hypothetical protein
MANSSDDVAKAAPTFREFGTTGLRQWSGFIRDEFLRELQGQRGMAKLREMSDNDDIVGACLFAIEQLAGQVDWSVVPAEVSTEGPEGEGQQEPKTPQLDERGEFLRTALFEDMDRPFRETVKETLSMLVYGFAPLEIVYKRRMPSAGDPAESSRFSDGRIAWAKWAIRTQDTVYRWEFDGDTGRLLGVVQKTEDKPEAFIPAEKLLLFRASTKRGNPEGRSILRSAYVSWFFKKRIREVEGIGIERDLAGLPVLTAPENEDWWNPNDDNAATKLAYARALVTRLRNDEEAGIVLPFGTKLELLGGQGAGKKIDTNAVITRYDQRIAMTMLADFILIGHEQVGSKALASTKLDAFTLALTAFLDHIEDLINRVAVPRLWKLNGWPLENVPIVKHGKVSKVDLQALGDYIQKASAAGLPLFPNVNLEKHLHDVAEFPAPPEGFEARAEAIEREEQESLEREAEQAQLDMDLQRELTGMKVGAKPAAKPRAPRAKKAATP